MVYAVSLVMQSDELVGPQEHETLLRDSPCTSRLSKCTCQLLHSSTLPLERRSEDVRRCSLFLSKRYTPFLHLVYDFKSALVLLRT